MQGDPVLRQLRILLKPQIIFLLVLLPGTSCHWWGELSRLWGGAFPPGQSGKSARNLCCGACAGCGDSMVNTTELEALKHLHTRRWDCLDCTVISNYFVHCTYTVPVPYTLYLWKLSYLSSLRVTASPSSRAKWRRIIVAAESNILSQTLKRGVKRSQDYAEPLPKWKPIS